MNKALIRQGARLELARRNFFDFCKLKAPDFYTNDREFLKEICNEMQEFIESGEQEVLIINLPPRFGKSRTAVLFAQWLFGKSIHHKIMTASYNEKLSSSFAKNVRNSIQEEKSDESRIVYNDIFSDVKVQKGDASMNLWSLEGGYNSYLATSPTGTSTGFGANYICIDDLIKNAEEALNEEVLEKLYSWFTNTLLSRLEEDGKIIIIMTRWSSNDLAGRIIEDYKDKPHKLKLISKKALQDDGTMLCEEILSRDSYEKKTKAMAPEIASANYQQVPINIKGRLYTSFSTYTKLPTDEEGNLLFTNIISYCDTADQGKDYLCNIIAGVYNNRLYVLDVYYTKDGMEITESETAKRLDNYNVNIAHVESNSGGRGFARQVERILKEKYKGNRTVIKWFHQSKNKMARILSNSTWVMENVLFPVDWRDRFPAYYKSMTEYQREGKNKNDDAQDAISGLCERMNVTGVSVLNVNL